MIGSGENSVFAAVKETTSLVGVVKVFWAMLEVGGSLHRASSYSRLLQMNLGNHFSLIGICPCLMHSFGMTATPFLQLNPSYTHLS